MTIQGRMGESLTLTDAAEASRQFWPLIEVGARDPEMPGEPPPVFVRDNGMGIEPEYHERVFGLFERLAPEVSEGTEIGLTLVY